MITDILKRSAAGLVSAAVAFALVLSFPGATQAQELALTKGDLESSLNNPDPVIERLKQRRGAKAVTFVGIGDILKSEGEAEQLQQQHSQGTEAFRQALRQNDEMLQNVQRKLKQAQYQVDDVIAIHVASRATPGENEGDEQRQEMAAHEVIYIVVPGTLYPGTPGAENQPRRDTAARGAGAGAMGQEGQVSQQQLQQALENPDEQLRQIRQMSDVEQRNVKVVTVDQIVRDRQTVQQWRQQNSDAITKFQSELRDNQTMSQALEQKNHRVDDVLVVFVGDQQRQEMGREEQPRPEGERQAGQQQKTLYVVVSASGETRSEMGRTTEQDSVIN